MSPLTLDRVKKANGKVRIVESNDKSGHSVQIQEGGAWITIYTNSRELCEQVIRGANSKLILG